MLGEQFVSDAFILDLTLIDNYYKRGNAAAVHNQDQAHRLLRLIPYLSCMRAQETAPTFVLMHGLVYVYSCF